MYRVARNTVWRLVALVLLLANGTPAVLEQFGHHSGEGEPLHHVEAASERHHGDHCLSVGVGEKIAPLVAVPTLETTLDPVAPPRVTLDPVLVTVGTRRPASRGPPLPV